MKPNAFQRFYEALKGASALYGAWDQHGSFVDHLDELARGYFTDDADRDAYLQAGRLIEADRATELHVDLSQVAALKVLTDITLVRKFDQMATAETDDEAP